MIIYNPRSQRLLEKRVKVVEDMFSQTGVPHCFVSGSFLYKEKYGDIDIFVVSRTKKKITFDNSKVNLTVIDFNDLSSLFYYSVSKSCIAKNILPKHTLKVTLSDYWHVINEAIPTIFNQKDMYHKDIRFLILYTEYFKTGNVLDTFELTQKIDSFQGYVDVLNYVRCEVPFIFAKGAKISYLKRFFYTQAGFYKDMRDYKAQDFLYTLTHEIVLGREV